MSLSLRIILLILGVVFVMLLAGSLLVVNYARDSVSDEISASSKHTLRLLSAALVSVHVEDPNESQQILLNYLQKMEQTRHLSIMVLHADGTLIQSQKYQQQDKTTAVPQWFSDLIAPSPAEYRQRFGSRNSMPTEIIIIPHPEDEIQELWNELRAIVGLILTFTALSIVLIALVIKFSLRPLKEISTALSVMKSGDEFVRLPKYRLPDLNTLALSFNRMSEELESHQRENRRLSKRALEAAENERRHLAQELHDELGQSISAIKAVASSLHQKDDSGKKAARSIIDISDHIYGTVRSMMNRLRPAVLDEFGLIVALERLVDDWNEHHENTFCKLSIRRPLEVINQSSEIQIYRIVQEALTNVAKHARASEVEIYLQCRSNGKISLIICDDGQGFDLQAQHTGMGLPGLRERVHSMNGKLSLESRPGEGVMINIEIIEKTDEKNKSTFS